MSLAAMFGHDLLGEAFEKGATLFGALLVAGSHLANFRRCRALDCEQPHRLCLNPRLTASKPI